MADVKKPAVTVKKAVVTEPEKAKEVLKAAVAEQKASTQENAEDKAN